MDRITFSATVEHPERGSFNLTVDIPIRTCWQHEPDSRPDEDTPTPPHVYSDSAYHTDYVVCLAVQP